MQNENMLSDADNAHEGAQLLWHVCRHACTTTADYCRLMRVTTDQNSFLMTLPRHVRRVGMPQSASHLAGVLAPALAAAAAALVALDAARHLQLAHVAFVQLLQTNLHPADKVGAKLYLLFSPPLKPTSVSTLQHGPQHQLSNTSGFTC